MDTLTEYMWGWMEGTREAHGGNSGAYRAPLEAWLVRHPDFCRGQHDGWAAYQDALRAEQEPQRRSHG